MVGKPRNQYSRPSVLVMSKEEHQKREWKHALAGTLSSGDIVADFGKIESVAILGGAFEFTNVIGEKKMFGYSDDVFAFTATVPMPPAQAPAPFGDGA